jgi:uncharacterized protein (DUF169 family)
MNEMSEIITNATKLMRILGLAAPPVGVRFLRSNQPAHRGAIRLNRHRYCQALMEIRGGQVATLVRNTVSQYIQTYQ